MVGKIGFGLGLALLLNRRIRGVSIYHAIFYNLMMELVEDDTQTVHDRLEECTQWIIQYCLAQLECGAQITSIGDSTSGPDLISPDMYREFALPYHKKIAEAVHKAGGMLANVFSSRTYGPTHEDYLRFSNIFVFVSSANLHFGVIGI